MSPVSSCALQPRCVLKPFLWSLAHLQALRRGEAAREHRQSIDDTKARARAVRSQTEGLKKRTRGVKASCKAANDLMMQQTSSISSSCRDLEVP